MRRFIAIVACVLGISFAQAEDLRSVNVDFIFLVDTSLSMDTAIADVKQYLAGEVVGPLLIPGDWVYALTFYGDTRTLWSGDIAGEPDKASLLRSLKGLSGNGRYTDIGKALDALDRIVGERGLPERPKYILLLTDERQEAPKGTKYYSADYTVKHPTLTYIKRVDKGSFRVITVGYGLDSKISGGSKLLVTTLAEPPARPNRALPGDGVPPDAEGRKAAAGTGSRNAAFPGAFAPYAVGAIVLAAVIGAVVFFARRRSRDEDGKEDANAHGS